MGDPFDLKKGNGLTQINAIVLLVIATIGHVRRILGQISDITKRAEEQFFTSNQSKKVVSVSMHFIIEFTLNPSIHIFFVYLSLMSLLNVLYIKERILQSCLHRRQKTMQKEEGRIV